LPRGEAARRAPGRPPRGDNSWFVELLPWALFTVFVVGVLALDLGVFHRNAHAVTRREALTWTGIWVGLALLFNIGVYVYRGTDAGVEWTTGCLIEQSLSVDNVFVWLLIFARFGVPAAYQHRVLFWGIVGALVLRAIMIAFAGVLLDQLYWTIYAFGAFLIFTGLRIARGGHGEPDIEGNPLLRLARRVYPVTPGNEGQSLTVVRNGVRYITPLVFVRTKMLLIDVYKIPSPVSLLVVASILAVAIGASLVHRSRHGVAEGGDHIAPSARLTDPA
jgi:tellurite resistance protein TerC